MKKSENNLGVIQNFLLHVTHCDNDDGELYWKSVMEITPETLYQMALDYIEEDHVDGKSNEEDHIVTYGAESSFQHEDKDKEYPEYVVVVADFGEEVGTCTAVTIDSTDVDGVQELLNFIKNPEFP